MILPMPRVTALKIAIVTSGLTTTEVARRVGVDESVVSRWANGHRAPKLSQARAMSTVLGREIDELFPPGEEVAA